jgi:hypothetical protein
MMKEVKTLIAIVCFSSIVFGIPVALATLLVTYL